ncbi:MAG: chromosomal replication initiator protein DnaA [Eubacteriales bacterium]
MANSEGVYNPYVDLQNTRPDLAKKYQEIWQGVLQYLQQNKKIEESSLNLWFRDVYIVAISATAIAFFLPSSFYREVIAARFSQVLAEAVEAVLGHPYELRFLEEGEKPFPIEEPQAPTREEPAASPDRDYEYTFDTFIVGNSNQFAHAAAVAVANTPAAAYNPLFIYGGSGLGKTHLLYAIMNRTRENNPGANIVYLKGDEFTNEFIQSIQNGKQMEFRSKYRYADLLLVDDIQFIAGKEGTQEEFFHTFNTLYEAKKQIVLTSDRPPKEMAILEERLRTRFEWGLIVDVQPPDLETRMAIIQRKANALGMKLPENVVAVVATNVKTNIRQLEGAVKKIKAMHQLTGQEITEANVLRIIQDMFTNSGGKALTPDSIALEVAKYYGLKPADLLSKKRTNEVAVPRQIAMYIIRETTDLSLPAIGKHFGGRDHTTVMHAIKKVEQEMEADASFKQQVHDLMKNIREG